MLISLLCFIDTLIVKLERLLSKSFFLLILRCTVRNGQRNLTEIRVVFLAIYEVGHLQIIFIDDNLFLLDILQVLIGLMDKPISFIHKFNIFLSFLVRRLILGLLFIFFLALLNKVYLILLLLFDRLKVLQVRLRDRFVFTLLNLLSFINSYVWLRAYFIFRRVYLDLVHIVRYWAFVIQITTNLVRIYSLNL